MDYGAGDAAAGVLCDVPVLDACVGACSGVGARAVVGVCSDVADGEDIVVKVRNGEVFVCLDGAVLFEGDGGVVAEEVCRRTDANAQDDEIGWELGAVFQVDGADLAGIRGRRSCFFDGGGELELDACFFEVALEDAADLFAHDGFHGGFVHADDGDVVFFGKGIAYFHSNEGAADDDDLLVLLLADGAQDGLHVCHESEQEDVTQFLEPGKGEWTRDAASCENQLGVWEVLAGFGLDGFLVKIDRGHFVGDGVDGGTLVPLARSPEDLLGIGD